MEKKKSWKKCSLIDYKNVMQDSNLVIITGNLIKNIKFCFVTFLAQLKHVFYINVSL